MTEHETGNELQRTMTKENIITHCQKIINIIL